MPITFRGLLVIGMLCMVMGFIAVPVTAADGVSTNGTLPRAFQSAQLGMTLSELVAVVSEAKQVSLGERDKVQRTVVVPSKDRILQRVEYRFYDDRLRELVIHYDYGQVPGGYQGMLERLRESYGKPLRQNVQEYYTKPEAFSERNTIWKDHATMASLTESRKMNGDRRELILTITDLTVHQAIVDDQERRQQELGIPIPLPSHAMQNPQASVVPSHLVKNSYAEG